MEKTQGTRGCPSGKRKGEWGSEGAPGPLPVDLHSMSSGGAQESRQGCSWAPVLGGDVTPRLPGAGVCRRAFSRPRHEDPDGLRQAEQGQAAKRAMEGATFQRTGEGSAGNVFLKPHLLRKHHSGHRQHQEQRSPRPRSWEGGPSHSPWPGPSSHCP